ncbi:MAG: hypothetical protein ACPG4T_06500 [Nannocystaceae bacterium]
MGKPPPPAKLREDSSVELEATDIESLRPGPPPAPGALTALEETDVPVPRPRVSTDASEHRHTGDRGETVLFAASEFGLALAELLQRNPDYLGAVLCDIEGDPIDFARRPSRISSLDIQIVGAQLQLALISLNTVATRHQLDDWIVLIEASHGTLVGQLVCGDFVFALLCGASQDPDTIVNRCRSSARELAELLEA